MKVAGIVEKSLTHFPGSVAYVIFTQGCNFRCNYCYNSATSRAFDPEDQHDDQINEILAFLKKESDNYEAVVITGGEPTLQKDLLEVLSEIKKLGLKTKLETNGTHPKILSKVISQGLLDYVAMDIKAPLEKEKYKEITGVAISTSQLGKINKSIRILTKSNIDYEIRTTLIKEKHSFHDILDICNTVVGCKKYCLQEFNSDIAYDQKYTSLSGYSKKELERLIKAINPDINEVVFNEGMCTADQL